jgi:nucleotide-binding universal stress UspA family protein
MRLQCESREMNFQHAVENRIGDRVLDTTARVEFKNVMVATDFSSAAEKALRYAIEIAGRYTAMLHVAHVSGLPVYAYAPAAAWPKLAEEDRAYRENAKAHLEAQLQSVPHQTIFRDGDVWQVLSNLIREKEADLLVIGTHGRSGIEKALLGSVAEKLFREASCPVLTVGPQAIVKSRHAAELSRILYATNFSTESLAAAPYAISLAREHRAHLILLTCREEGPETVRGTLQTLGQLVPFGADLRCEPICVVERGPHGEKILEVAESHGADLIALGVERSPNELDPKPHFHRSELYKIVTQATCPVLTVRA